ncbi:hypothetical protein EMIHUDRAFT_208355 [Emiliania huxleyi CCMP1516]|uniref:Uncharacterized protein n=2 Tax=Emiliania huxleyi TaxID=2903 RepID=A0A0D3JAE7_EMIH1|nr:hypothetical protein EMIHUDRAFT_208355 [Emiliania huxleyi CCMP1516]EOD20482.1 hypothetical protein EMIHUDRAFT_208355 [Emiliania huxleyi CCMP1516]|eukprot:XP_005772911.1 hypothetical protein EMIHUDRAFT_208355 [Emiliania huxleyi CCMP1516]
MTSLDCVTRGFNAIPMRDDMKMETWAVRITVQRRLGLPLDVACQAVEAGKKAPSGKPHEELGHAAMGNIADSGAQLRLPATRGPAMLLHSKGLAALAPFLPFFLERFPPQRAATPSLRQLSEQVAAVGSARAEQGARKGERVYSPRMLAGFCAMLNEGCAGCTRLPLVRGKIGRLVAAEAAASDFRCEVARGACDVRPAVWPRGDEPGLPDWYQRFLRQQSTGVD